MNAIIEEIERVGNLDDIVREALMTGETLFVERPDPLTSKEAEKRVQPDCLRVVTILEILQHFIGGLKKSSKPARGLEIGTGYGGLIMSLGKVFGGWEWHGVEHPERRYLKDARYHELMRAHGCRLIQCDIVKDGLPFPNNYFTVVTFSEVLEHLPLGSVHLVIGELSRVLCPGGVLLCSSPNLAMTLNRVRLLFGKAILDVPLPLDYAGGTFGHIRLYTAGEFVALAKPFGMKVATIRYQRRMGNRLTARSPLKKAAVWLFNLFDSFISTWFKEFSDTWYVMLKKEQVVPIESQEIMK